VTAEILVNVTPRESRAAFLENGVLQEVYIERANRRGITGNIYKGRVSRVLPGTQAAFIERLGRAHGLFARVGHCASRRCRARYSKHRPRMAFGAAVTEGDELLVQVLKDPLGTKGARLTTFITLPSRYLVYMPQGRGVGAPRASRMKRSALGCGLALETLAAEHPGGDTGRTVAEGVDAEALRAEHAVLAPTAGRSCRKRAFGRRRAA
jgi:ribonuclease G